MDIASTGLAGAKQAEARVDQVARRLARGPSQEPRRGEDRVELTSEAAQLIEAVNSYTANLRLIQTADEMTKHAIDLTG